MSLSDSSNTSSSKSYPPRPQPQRYGHSIRASPPVTSPPPSLNIIDITPSSSTSSSLSSSTSTSSLSTLSSTTLSSATSTTTATKPLPKLPSEKEVWGYYGSDHASSTNSTESYTYDDAAPPRYDHLFTQFAPPSLYSQPNTHEPMPTHSPIPSLPSTSNTLHGLGTPQGVHPGPPAFSLSPSSSTSYMRGGTRSERLAGGVLRATAGLRDLPRPKEYADIVFLMDVTLSMDKYIENARETLINIMAKVGDQVPNFEPRVAFIGYRDYNDKDRFEMMDFTTNLTQLVDFIGKVKAKGGGDYPEDVKGGLCQVLKLDWKSRCKILLHVADAPPHGTRFHGGKYRDHFPDGGIAEKTFEEIFEFMTSHRIVYNFMRLNSSCDIMVREFNSIMGLFQGGKEIRVSELRTTDVVVFLEMMVKSISSSIRAR